MNERDETALKEAIKALGPTEFRTIVKQAIRELLDEYALKFGWFSIATISVGVLGGALILALIYAGIVKPGGS